MIELIKSRLAKEAAATLIFRAFALGSAFLSAVLLARMLGADGYGVYSYALAIVGLLSLPAQSGTPILLMRETARNSELGQPALIRGVWNWSGRLTGLLSMTLILGGLGFVLLTNGTDLDARAWTLLLAFALIPVVSLGNLRGAALRGLERVLAGTLPEFVLRPGIFLLLLGVALMAAVDLTPALAMAFNISAAFLAFLIGVLLLWKHTPQTVRVATPEYERRQWFSSVLPMALIAGMMTISSSTDIIMLGIMKTDTAVGVYRIASQMAVLVSVGMEAVNMVIAPRFAKLYASGNLNKLQALSSGSARIVLVGSIGLVTIFALIGQELIDRVFGEEFSSAYLPMLILMIGGLVNAATGSTGYLLNMTGHERDEARVVTVTAILNVALNLAFIRLWGLTGAAIATTISYTVWRMWLWTYVRRRIGINSSAFSRKRKVHAIEADND